MAHGISSSGIGVSLNTPGLISTTPRVTQRINGPINRVLKNTTGNKTPRREHIKCPNNMIGKCVF